ncbi:MAG TPA: hypothetical protein VI320_08640 [Terracidiphilus sp.]
MSTCSRVRGVGRLAGVFTDAERAALALAEEGTQIACSCHDVSEKTWAEVSKHYEEDQIVALVFLIAMINASNRLSVLLRYEGGSYKHGMFSSHAS